MTDRAADTAGPHLRLRTPRLELRPVTSDDCDVLLALRNHPAVVATTETRAEMTQERMELQLRGWVDLWRTRRVGTWLVELDGRPVAFIAMDPIGDGYPGVDPEDLELGVVVHPDHWGSGIAAEAGLAAARDGFERVGLPRVYASLEPTNAKSVALVAKIPGARLLRADDGELVYELPNPAAG